MESKGIDINPNTVLAAGGVVVAYFGVIKPTLEKLGILDNADVIDNKAAETTQVAWKPTFWQQAPTNALILTHEAVKDYISIISDSFGVFSDNYNAVFGVFSNLKTKSQVSYLAYKFQQSEKVGLYQFLGNGGGLLPWDGLSSAHLATINKFVSSLPNYKP
ncbi:MAG: hypothetical protein Q8L07_04255 [Sediminibacterium sp.]|nr:hypothetical protein [Sediminibacterium sp.]